MEKNFFKGKSVLITGGTGFIGSNIIAALLPLGADISVLTYSAGSLDNILDLIAEGKRIGNKIKVIKGDIRDLSLMKRIVKNKDIIFNLAAKVSHMDKGVVSYEDLDTNVRGQLTLLEACRISNPMVRIIFSSTRTVYSQAAGKPLTENSPTDPISLYAIHKLAVEKYHLFYGLRCGLRPTILRIGNPFGERQHFSNGLYSLPGWFLNRAMNGLDTEITSDGKQKRDYIYITDLVEIMLRTCQLDKTIGQTYNVGKGIRYSFDDMLKMIEKTVGSGKFHYAKNAKKSNDSYSFDISKMLKDIGYKPKIDLEEGVRKMYTFAKRHPKTI